MPAYKGPGGRWRYRFTHNGKRFSGSTPKTDNTKRVAEQLERAQRDKIIARRFTGVVPTVAAFAPRFLAYQDARLKPMSMIANRSAIAKRIIPALGDLPLDEITREHLDGLVTDWSKTFSPKSVNVYMGVLRRMLAVALEWEILDRMPRFTRVRQPEPVFRFLTDDEATALLDGAEPEWRSMFLIGLRTGLRAGELRGLEWGDVDLTGRRIHVRRTDPGRPGMTSNEPKGGRARVVPLTPEAVECLRDLASQAPKRKVSDRVWLPLHHKRNGEMTPGRTETHGFRAMVRATRKAKLEGVSWHALRHTCASWLIMRGVPHRVVQAILGHASLTETERYSHLLPSFTHANVDLLDTPLAPSQGEAKALSPGTEEPDED